MTFNISHLPFRQVAGLENGKWQLRNDEWKICSRIADVSEVLHRADGQECLDYCIIHGHRLECPRTIAVLLQFSCL